MAKRIHICMELTAILSTISVSSSNASSFRRRSPTNLSKLNIQIKFEDVDTINTIKYYTKCYRDVFNESKLIIIIPSNKEIKNKLLIQLQSNNKSLLRRLYGFKE